MANEQVMTQESFTKNHNQAVTTLLVVGKVPMTKANAEEFRAAYAAEVAASYLPKVIKPADVLTRYSQLHGKGGLIAIPAGVKGRRVDKVAIAAEVAATCAALDAAKVAYTIDDKGAIVIG